MKRLICNGTIIDGTGEDAFTGDVLIDGDRIAAVIPGGSGSFSVGLGSDGDAKRLKSTLNGLDADEVIDATGKLMTPGFIDAHAHSDAYLVLEPDAPSKISQGITTEINGQCGGSIAPRYGEARLSSDWAALLGEKLTWRSLAEYREVLAAAKPALNTIQFIGHNTLRSSVAGYCARPLADGELAAMTRLLEQSLDEGGWGLTTGLIYQPGRYSTPAEVVALAKATAAKGGFYATHMRSEGDRILEAIDEVLDLVKATGIRAEISHLKTSGKRNWSKIDAVLGKIEGAVADGLLLGSDRYPYCAAGTDLDIVLPDWAQEGGVPAEIERIKSDALKAKIIEEVNASDRDWSTVMIGGTWHPDNEPFSGRRVSEILRRRSAIDESTDRRIDESRLTPGELIVSILEKDGFKTGGFFFGMSEENLAKIYSRPWIVPGSDASLRSPRGPLGADHPHPRAYATMPEFYRRVRALGFTREETVARMTSVPCDRFGIRGRGRLVPGAYADLVVWKEEEFKALSTFDEPHRFSGGVELVMVNGSVPYRRGVFTGDRAGRFLERDDSRCV